MSDSENITLQEFLKHEFERWQSQYYQDVYSLFEKRDEHRLIIALNHWEDRFTMYLRDKFPRLVDSYEIQTTPSVSLAYIGDPIKNFKPYKSNQIEAFLTQCIEDAKKGNLNQYYVAPNETPKTSEASSGNRVAIRKFLAFIFMEIPKTVGRLFFDLFGQGDKAAPSSTIIIGYVAITLVVLLLLRILSPTTLIDVYRFFNPEPK